MEFKIRYRQSVTDGGTTVQDEKIIDTFDSVWDVSPLNSAWTNAGCYAGAIPANDSDIGTYSVATWTDWNKDSVYSDMRDMTIKSVKGSSQQNLRFMAKYNSSSFDVNRQYYNWTNLRDSTARAVKDAIDALEPFTVYDPYKRQDKNVLTTGNSNSPLNIAPLEHLEINNLIFVPRFVIKEFEYYNYDAAADGYKSIINTSVSTMYSWADIKPADNTPAGEHYDADLFEKGWKEIDPVNEDGKRFRFCLGVYLIPYYGKSSNSYNAATDTYNAGTNPDDGRVYGDRQVFGSVPSQTDEYPVIEGTTTMNRPCLMVMTESYNEVTGGLTYSTPTGIMFSNFVPSGNVAGNELALHSSWSLMANFQTFSAASYWSPVFNPNNRDYSNMYADVDPATSNTAPDLTILTKIDMDIDVSHLYDLSGLDTTVHFYLPNNNPIAFSYQKGNRNFTATNCAFFSINALWHTIASLGCYVADDFTAAQKAPTGYYTGNNNHLYLGHMDASGITDGIMLQGGDIPSSVQSGIDDIIQHTPYTPVTPTPPGPAPSDDGIDDTDKGTGTNLPAFGLKLAGSGGFMSYFLLGMSGLTALATALATTAQSFWAALGTATDFRTSNLLQYISSLKWYPIDILAGNQGLYADIDTTDITFGFDSNAKLPLGTSIKKLGTTIRVYNMGAVQIPYKLGHETFLDKDPYSTVQVWLPFCGMYPVKSDFVVGNTVAFYYVIDLVTGMCTALVTNGQQTLLNVSGKIGVDYAVTGNDIITQSERMAGAYVNSALSAISGGINLGTSIASENAIGAVTASAGLLGDIAKSSIDIASAKRAVPVAVSAGSGFGSSFAPNTPCVIVNPPAIRLPEDYGHAQGYVYNQTVSIGSVSGFTVCDNPDLSGIPATAAELDMIRSILTSGFYA